MTEIHSYRAVFDLERRIYRIDRLRLNPGGVPLRGVIYFLALLAAALLAARVPLIGAPLAALPWYASDLLLPGVSAAALTAVRIDGRPFHLAAESLARDCLGSGASGALRAPSTGAGALARVGLAPAAVWRPPAVLLVPDGSDARLRRLRYTGPGAVLVAVAHVRTQSGRAFGDGGRRRAARTRWPALGPHMRLTAPGAGSRAEVEGVGVSRKSAAGRGRELGAADTVIVLGDRARMTVGNRR